MDYAIKILEDRLKALAIDYEYAGTMLNTNTPKVQTEKHSALEAIKARMLSIELALEHLKM